MSQKTMITLNNEIDDFLRKKGAISVGFATLETLAGGPPSVNLTYVLPEAQSAINFALALNKELIRDFLVKKSIQAHKEAEDDQIKIRKKIDQISNELSEWLGEKGFKAVAIKENEVYRTDIENWRREMYPDISHRYIAAAAGTGSFGWSGNIGVKGYGTAILLGTVVTSAELTPTKRIPPEEGFCIKCKLCVAACPSKMFDAKETTEVTIGGEKFSYSRRNDKMRCNFVCGGFCGLHPSGKWSTWSPGRFKMPEVESKFMLATATAIYKYTKWPERKPSGGFENPLLPGVNLRMTCGMCQKICWGDKDENRKNYDLLINSGCVLQKPDGGIVILPPDEAQKMFDEFPRKHKKLYS